MTRTLLAISIGPVQDFIAAARKTSDLQAGSDLLVEIAKEAATVVKNAGGELIFPAPDESDVIRDGPNKILAVLKGGADAGEIAGSAKQAARAFLFQQWDKVAKSDLPLHTNRALRQIETFLEFYTAWFPIEHDSKEGYQEAREAVERLLAGRKALRDFEPPEDSTGIPKSPLDPSRECVLRLQKDRIPEGLAAGQRRLKRNEYLDAVSLLKRHATNEQKTPSTSLMVFRSYEAVLRHEAPDILAELDRRCDSVKDASIRPDLGDVFLRETPDMPGQNPGETEPDFTDRTARWKSEYRLLRGKAKDARDSANIGEMLPYYAILVADGDKMGKIIGELNNMGDHKDLSAALTTFAECAKTIVPKRWNGHLVYSGGDDVLALLPVTTAMKCAAQLAQEFQKLLLPLKERAKLKPDGEGGTLSVGIAIVHHLESLQISLERARQAERAAKKQRNSLALALHTRGGSPLTVSDSWSHDPLTSWDSWIRAFRAGEQGKGLSRGFPYELRDLLQEWKGCEWPPERAGAARLRLRNEITRILKRKKGAREGDVPVIVPDLPDYNNIEAWENFADKLILARFLASFPEAREVTGG